MNGSYAGKPCPKCGHVRAASETAPDWQCPKCGIVYAKFLQAQSAPEPVAAVRRAAESESAPVAASGSHGLAMFAHLSILLGFIIPLLNIIVPVVIWKMKSGEDELAVACAKEAINFQISILLWWLALGAGVLLSMMVIPPLIYVAGLLGAVLFLASLILPIIAAVKASDGESYYYPRIWHIFE